MLFKSQTAAFVCLLVYIIPAAFSQAIPYSYASGRDVAAVEARYAKFQAAKASNASTEALLDICGRVADFSAQQCTTKVGRPKDSESLACDSLCCLAGSKVGNCGSDYGVKLNPEKLLAAVGAGVVSGGVGYSAVIGAVDVKVAAKCYCSDDPADVRCGRDGSFMGIRCPFDNSSCWRKCCRDGKNSGKCGGFLRSKCKCS